jgi:predicted amidohydrolase YtcJ
MRVLLHGRIRTLVDQAPEAEALAYERGRLVAVGREEAVLAAAGPGAQVVDLDGRTVVPGFVDAHHHLALAVLYQGTVDCRGTVAPTLVDLLARLRATAATVPPGAWVVGSGYDVWQLAERRHPTREELDAACPHHPVLLMHFSFHECVANSQALELAGIGRSTPDPPAGYIVRGRRGEPTGHLRETALSPVETLARQSLLARDPEAFAARLRTYEDRLFARGITRVADPTVSPGFERLYREIHAAGRMRIPVLMMPICEGGYLVHPWERLDGVPTGEGPEELRVGPLKLFMDGGDNCAVCMSAGQVLSASLQTLARAVAQRSLAPFRAARRGRLRLGRDLRLHSGVMYYRDAAGAREMARRAVERGFGLAIHAMGNEGVGLALEALEEVRARHRDLPPPRIEHAMMVEPSQLQRLADVGASVVVQPGFLGALTEEGLPPLPGLQVLAFRSMRDAGLRLAGSSDSPVLEARPLEEMRQAMTRQTQDGNTLGADEALDAVTVLALYTREAARACGCLDVTGTLEPGKRADLVILSEDPLETRFETRVVETVLRGETVFRRED